MNERRLMPDELGVASGLVGAAVGALLVVSNVSVGVGRDTVEGVMGCGLEVRCADAPVDTDRGCIGINIFLEPEWY